MIFYVETFKKNETDGYIYTFFEIEPGKYKESIRIRVGTDSPFSESILQTDSFQSVTQGIKKNISLLESWARL